MDGVERVMVLGILAVIVAILSFAWSATEDEGLPVAAGTNAGGLVPLSSNSNARGGVIIPSPSLEQRLSDPDQIARQRELLREQMLGNKPDASPFDGGNPVGGRSENSGGPAREVARQQPPPLLTPNDGARQRGGQRDAGDPSDPRTGNPEQEAGAKPGSGDPTGRPGTAARGNGTRNGTRNGTGNGTGTRVTIVDPHSTVAPGTEARIMQRPGQATPLKAATNEAAERGSDTPSWELYTLRQGDTLWSLASDAIDGGSGDVKATIALIQQLNPGLDADNLSVGRTIKMPVGLDAPIVTKAPEKRVSEEGGRVYVVQEGDSLGGIAERELGAERRWKDIYELNRHLITDPGTIRVGQRLVLPEE